MICQPGDLIFFAATPRGPILRRLIGAFQLLSGDGQDRVYGHVAIAEDSQTMIEETWPRARRRAIELSDPSVEVWRVRGATKYQCRVAVVNAQNNVGELYDLGGFFFGLFPNRHRAICSTFVARAWQEAGVALRLRNSSFTPDSLMSAGQIERVYRGL